MSTVWLLALYCALIVAASVGGGWLPSLVRMTHLRTQMLMSFVAGLMLGIATLHLLPHALEWVPSPGQVGIAMLVGVLLMFFLLRVFHVHSHGDAQPQAACGHDHDGGHGAHHDHDEAGEMRHGLALPTLSSAEGLDRRSLSWVGMLFGLGLHTVMDGVALGASVAADAGHGAWMGLAGLGTFLAVALHKPLDAFAIGSVMSAGGWSPVQRTLVNLAFSLCCPIGAAVFFFGVTRWGLGEEMLGCGLALSAGFFVCIALADLLPEVHFHDHDRVKLTASLALGILLAVAIENLPGHSHDHHLHDAAGMLDGHAGHSHDGHNHGPPPADPASDPNDPKLTPGQRFRARLRTEHQHP
jgi:zinc and cadmium transporter